MNDFWNRYYKMLLKPRFKKCSTFIGFYIHFTSKFTEHFLLVNSTYPNTPSLYVILSIGTITAEKLTHCLKMLDIYLP